MSWLTKYKGYEKAVESVLPEKSFVVIRFDGKAFHTFTKNFKRPYDEHFAATMTSVAEHLCNVIDGAIFAYTQSDEISVVFSDLKNDGTQMWSGGRVQKMVSVGAANATAKYMSLSPTELFPIFDGRVHTLADLDEVVEYVRWRRSDATKNAITMAASTLYSHKQLNKKTTSERKELLRGTALEVLPDDFLFGRLTTKEYFNDIITYVDKRDQSVNEVEVVRSRWVSEAASDASLTKITHPAASHEKDR